MRKIVYDVAPVRTNPIEPLLRQHLIQLVTAYTKFTGYRLSTVAVYANVSGDFFENLIAAGNGRKKVTDRHIKLWVKSYDDLVADFAKKWPKGLPFPSLDDAAKSLKQETNHGKASKERRTETRRAG